MLEKLLSRVMIDFYILSAIMNIAIKITYASEKGG